MVGEDPGANEAGDAAANHHNMVTSLSGDKDGVRISGGRRHAPQASTFRSDFAAPIFVDERNGPGHLESPRRSRPACAVP